MVAAGSGFLLDTNVISELMKARPSRRVIDWVDATAEALLYLSVITLGEVRKGIDLLDDADPKRVALQSWLDHDLRVRFGDRLLDFDAGVAERWGQFEGDRQETTGDASHDRCAARGNRAPSRPDLRYPQRRRRPSHGRACLQSVARLMTRLSAAYALRNEAPR